MGMSQSMMGGWPPWILRTFREPHSRADPGRVAARGYWCLQCTQVPGRTRFRRQCDALCLFLRWLERIGPWAPGGAARQGGWWTWTAVIAARCWGFRAPAVLARLLIS